MAEELSKNNNMFEGLDTDPDLRMALTSDQVQERGIIIINAQGIIQMVNQVGLHGWVGGRVGVCVAGGGGVMQMVN